jgi:glycosyltransferase involved in cell wall biosynthesis
MITTNHTLIVLTDSFPYGLKETFLENEVPFLAEAFDVVHLFPLHGEGSFRPQASNVVVHSPFLSFNPKNQKRLFMAGLFNRSPLGFALKEWIAKSVYKHPLQWRVWAAALLVFRASVANQKRMAELRALLSEHTVVYSYWGDKLALLIPELKIEHESFKSVVRFHRTDLYEAFKGGYIPFRSILLPKVDHAVFISNDGKRYLETKYRSLIRHSHLFRLGVADHGVNPANAAQMFHLVSCSYMVPVKRIPLLMDALKLLHLPVRWTHIGSGPLYQSILKNAASLPDYIQTEWLGEKSNSEVLAYYAATPVDLFINVSESEGVPVSIMEALSFGIPVMATNAGGTGEIVDEQVGALLPVDISSSDLAKAIRQFMEQPDKTTLRLNARKRWQERCDAESNFRAFATFLLTV